ncbi:dihydrofolate reductase [Metabacillus sp. GX 13764]|uniref:dihydrofolate reductase n=1 Tax=Metabacillus kandeliae TaxID=2900151 RepID=UPI001E39E796|nr:dihydrofolate reductase [Metabacillus kandeliae]MCD7033459.1 dihydrofolate reductase [Metabacillus kandeliae]
MISFLLAMDENRVIGKNNDLPWRLPADLAYFKRITMGHKIVMGRKTFESMGRPLPGRENLVVTRNGDFQREGVKVIDSPALFGQEAMGKEEEIFVIGGEEIFRLFLPYCQKLYITEIHHAFEGDRRFPEMDMSDWEVISRVKGERNEKNPYDYEFLVYKKA